MENSEQPQQVSSTPAPVVKKPKVKRRVSERSTYIGNLIKSRPKGMSVKEAMSTYSKQAKEHFTKQKLKKSN